MENVSKGQKNQETKKIMHMRLIQFLVMIWSVGSFVAFAQELNSRFMLLSDEKNGIMFFKDECKKNAFSLVFSFSQDLKEASYEGLALVEFSKNFKEDLKANHDGLMYAYLEVQSSQKMGNRQIRVDYVAKKVSDEGGSDTDLDIPEQIEVSVLDEDLKRIFDTSEHHLEAIDTSKKVRTLINANLETSCSP